MLAKKCNDLAKINACVLRLTKPYLGYLYLTKNQVCTTINSYRDNDRASYQFVFYLSVTNDGRIETTELISAKDISQLKKYKIIRDWNFYPMEVRTMVFSMLCKSAILLLLSTEGN